ncbi:MAG TPA: aminoglycoside phosphotransferase family protein [Pyrinomonadaceae bacterium]|nr:aminoglycoside phosphotransferase family protein [Pyrinomonadaceae bacterium]
MSREVTSEVILTDLREHPAIKAWHELGSSRVEPEAIVILKEHDKSAIYRLEGVGTAGSSIIGKRCKRTTATVERAIYEEILPYLPMPTLHYYGYIEEPEGEFCWLFLEDAYGDEFSPCIEEHRTLAARWLATMHTSAADKVGTVRLPDRGPAYYLRQLRSASDTIIQGLNNSKLNLDDLTTLRSVLSQFELLESHWGEVNRLSHSIPRTLVHGDFVAKNMVVRSNKAGMALLPFDWENAGYGVMITDLAQSPPLSTRFSANPDIATYWAVVRNYWPDVEIHALKRLANFGTLLRLIDAINWIAQSLAYEWVQEPMSKIEVYESRLAEVIRAVGLGE